MQKMKFGMLLAVITLSGAMSGLAAQGYAQAGRDFSGGITNASSLPAAAGAIDANWQAKQVETEAQAKAALVAAAANPQKDSALGPDQLGPGDKVRLTVFGEEDLSGEFEIDNTGSLALPLVGDIQIRGLTPRETEKKIASVLEQGYLKNPRVNIEVLNFRPFFILGEVNKPGSYPYANNMNVINAVALAGGYTTRAKTGKVTLRRANSPDKEETAGEQENVYPGDVIRVNERFF